MCDSAIVWQSAYKKEKKNLCENRAQKLDKFGVQINHFSYCSNFEIR